MAVLLYAKESFIVCCLMSQPKEDPRVIRAWCMYDWSTSGYQVTTASALLPVFFVQQIAPEGVTVWGQHFPATALWGFGIGLAAFFVFLMAPVLGAIADYTGLRKQFLVVLACGGSLFASLLFFSGEGTVWFSLILFILAQTCYTAGNVFYDSFLPQIAPDHLIDRISGRGFAYGYIGGAVQFGLALGLLTAHAQIGLSEEMALRIGLLTAGLWWIGFATYTFRNLHETRPGDERPPAARDVLPSVKVGVRRTWQIARRLPHVPGMLLFLAAFFLYNDGIQTVIGISAAYGGSELRLTPQAIMITFLIVQLIAFVGAHLFARYAEVTGTKAAILTALLVWIGVVVLAFYLPAEKPGGFFLLGAAVGLVLGGSQALSRSLFASMIPREASANFFGFYSVFNKLSAISGPLLFGALATFFNTARPAILALAGYFVVGAFLLALLDVKKARAGRNLWVFHEADVKVD